MRFKIQILGISFIFSLLGIRCNMMKCTGERLFEIKNAYYQSWVAKTNENGTNIFIDLVKTKEGVTFDSIIFRGLKLPVFIEDKEGTLHLKSIINSFISKIKPDFKVADAPDQLIYTFKGKKHSYLLKNIRRENMKYL